MTYNLNTKKAHELVVEILTNDCSEEMLISMNNDQDYSDDYIADNDEYGLSTLLGDDHDLHWVACRIFYGEYNPNDEYVKLDGYGNLVSFNSYNAEQYIDYDDLARRIVNGDTDLSMFEGYMGCDELQEIMELIQNAKDFDDFLAGNHFVTADDIVNLYNESAKTSEQAISFMDSIRNDDENETKSEIIKELGEHPFDENFDCSKPYYRLERGIIKSFDKTYVYENIVDFDDLTDFLYAHRDDLSTEFENHDIEQILNLVESQD